MPIISTRSPKTKVTVTLSHDLVRKLDELLNAPEASSRSQLIEEALRRWLYDRRKRSLSAKQRNIIIPFLSRNVRKTANGPR